jgi:hypothetical protein
MTETTTKTILEMNSKELVKVLATTLEYTEKHINVILNSIFISSSYIAASDGATMIINTIDNTVKADNFVTIRGNDIKIILATLKEANKQFKGGFNVKIEKENGVCSFSSKECINFLYGILLEDIKQPPKYHECIPVESKVLGLFSRESLLSAMAEVKGKYNQVTKQVYLSKDSITVNSSDGVETIIPIVCRDFDEYTQQVSFNYDYLLRLLKTSTSEGFILYTDKKAEITVHSPVWIEEDNTITVTMPLR